MAKYDAWAQVKNTKTLRFGENTPKHLHFPALTSTFKTRAVKSVTREWPAV